MNRKRAGKWLTAILVSAGLPALAAGMFLLVSGPAAQAAFDEESAVHVDAASIENATLAVGTHLIHLSAITDELYRKAVESAEESGQVRIYYKSELGEGAWYDITEGTGIRSITPQEPPVDNRVIEELFFRYHTKSDGVTYDLKQGNTVNPFDINNPYDLSKMPELEPLLVQFNLLNEKEKPTGSDRFCLLALKAFYETEVENQTTKECDRKLAALQKYYEELAANEEEAERLNTVTDVMGAIDAQRRAEVFTILNEQALVLLTDWMNGTGWAQEGMPEELTVNTEALTAAGNSMENVGQSLIEAQGAMLQEGTTVLSGEAYRYKGLLMQEAEAGNYRVCDRQVDALLHLSHIEKGTIVDAGGELELLDTELLRKAEEAYRSALSGGISDEYRAGLSNRSSQALLKQLLKTQKSGANISRLELQTLIQARTDRMEPEAAGKYITERIGQIGMFQDIIVQDDFQTSAQETVREHLDWLTELLKNLNGQTGGSVLDGLLSEKEALQEERLSCLDQNDLAGARKLEAQIAAKEEEIGAEEDRLNGILNAGSSTEAQKALARSALADGTAAAALQEIKNDMAAGIRSGDYSLLEDGLNSILQIQKNHPEAAAGALEDLNTELSALRLQNENNREIQNCLDRAARQLADTRAKESMENTPDSASGTGTGHGSANETGQEAGNDPGSGPGDTSGGESGSGPGSISGGESGAAPGGTAESGPEKEAGGKVLSVNDINALLAELLGGGQDQLSGEERTGALLAVNWYAEYTGSSAVRQMAAGMAVKLYREKIPYVYLTPEDAVRKYAPADALGQCTGYRYIYDDTAKGAVLQKKNIVYQFTAASRKVIRENGAQEEMPYAALYKNALYIEETYLTENFQCRLETIHQTEYGVIATEKMYERARELLEAMITEGGR